MTRIAVRIVIAGAIVIATMPQSVSSVRAAGGDEPRDEFATLANGAGETVVSVDQAGVRVFAVEDGFDLDQYLFRSSSPIDFSIELDADYGPVDSLGRPAPGNALFGKDARLTLRVEDVDENYPGTDVQPERDLVVVNGTTLDGHLSGADAQWSINTFSLPTNLLRLPTEENPIGRNDIQVLIDTANTGGDVWAVEVDWAELRPIIDSGPRPAAFLHGMNGIDPVDPSTNSIAPVRQYFADQHALLEDRVANPSLTNFGSIETNAGLLQPTIHEMLRSTGSESVNLVGHSFGGLSARRYAWDHRDEVNSVVMISTPNGGNFLADLACAGMNTPLITTQGVIGRVSDGCDGEEDGMYQLREEYIQDTFNSVVLDHESIEYVALASSRQARNTANLRP